MKIEVRRLKTLYVHELEELGRLMSDEVAFDDTSVGSSWVCWWQVQARFWTKERLFDMSDLDALGDTYRAWVAFVDGKLVAICSIAIEPEAILLTTFLVDTRAYIEEEQFAIADEFALTVLADIPQRDEIYGYFPFEGFAARYATRCGFAATIPGKPDALNPSPLRRWTHNPRKLEETIRSLRAD